MKSTVDLNTVNSRGRIYFHAGRCLPVTEHSLEERPLGGTETGLIRVAAGLQARGFEVTVFTSHRSPPARTETASPMYLPLAQATQAPAADVLISVMDWRGLFAGLRSRKQYLWSGDHVDQYANFGVGDLRVLARLDRFCAVSRWQGEQFVRSVGIPAERVLVVQNGVHLPFFTGEERRNRFRLVFSSAPYRGLGLAIPLYAALKQRVPQISFAVYSGLRIYDREQAFQGPLVAQYEDYVRRLQALPGVEVAGNISQQQLAREYMRSGLLFYPNTFVETSCITALEAMAAGCPVVTSALGALPETVADCGRLVAGTPGQREYAANFINAVVELTTNDLLWDALSRKALQRVREQYSWEHVIDRFEQALVQDLA